MADGTSTCLSLTHYPFFSSSFAEHKNQPWPMPINNGVLSPYFSTRSIFLCPLATCNQRYYLPATLPVQQLNIVQSQYPLFTIGR